MPAVSQLSAAMNDDAPLNVANIARLDVHVVAVLSDVPAFADALLVSENTAGASAPLVPSDAMSRPVV